MAVSRQTVLKEAWLSGMMGRMSGQTQAKAWALRELWKEEHGDKIYGMLTHIASKLHVISPPRAKKEHPTNSALLQFFEKIDNDEEGWYPGKNDQKKRGPDPAINGTNRNVIARSAMTMKENGKEPTYPELVAHNKKASLNPATQRPVDKKVMYKMLKTHCYDEDPEDKWIHDNRYSKTALTPKQIAARYTWAWELEGNILNPDWCLQHLIWTDICNSILPTTENLHQKQKLARKKKKGWGSKKSKKRSINLVGDQKVIKQKAWGTKKVWWAPILSRGKLHIEVMGEKFPGENEDGAAILVDHLRTAVDKRFPGASQPKTLFVDRGQGFYEKNYGKITPKFKEALQRNRFKAYYGDNAKAQPGAMHELMLHETAVAWIRYEEQKTRPMEPWREKVAEFASRMKAIALDINKRHKVDNLCKALPKRVQMLIDAEGDRIGKYSAHHHITTSPDCLLSCCV